MMNLASPKAALVALDRPVWNALATRQNALALGDMTAFCFDRDYSPFGAAANIDPNSLASLARLIPPDGAVWTVEVPGFPAEVTASVLAEPPSADATKDAVRTVMIFTLSLLCTVWMALPA